MLQWLSYYNFLFEKPLKSVVTCCILGLHCTGTLTFQSSALGLWESIKQTACVSWLYVFVFLKYWLKWWVCHFALKNTDLFTILNIKWNNRWKSKTAWKTLISFIYIYIDVTFKFSHFYYKKICSYTQHWATHKSHACITDIVILVALMTHTDTFHMNTPWRHSMEEIQAGVGCEYWAYHLWVGC